MGKLAEIAAEWHAAIASSDPQSMMEVKRDLADLPTALADFALGLRTLQSRAVDLWPVHPGVTQAVGTVHEAMTNAQTAAMDVPSAFLALHENDNQRHDNPRPGEGMWDVSRAQG